MEIPPIQTPRMIKFADEGYAQSIFQPYAAAAIAAQEIPVLHSHTGVNRRSGTDIERQSRNPPTALENKNANELASAMPFIFIGPVSAAENASVPSTLAAVVVIAAFGSDRANSARMITVEQAMPGSPMADQNSVEAVPRHASSPNAPR